MKTFTVIEYYVGDAGDRGNKIGTIEAESKSDAKIKWQQLHNISDYEICFYSFEELENY
ncbi:hypothetical protein [Chryseobacterium carnipullorum]|uniref:Uncharacterized protein n=1 Tax=Chryseobacterium carnipullorum TaxID=1124835 RepID=A0A376DVH3_CHRCU|nr:hypothetical protein [Chryseobacterium carnipullorum]STC95648.1 Uncharacterised protein [Chryseobacterium carnipullorum]